jgi:ABC-type multidrug transport system fused ATPase/permease subunit
MADLRNLRSLILDRLLRLAALGGAVAYVPSLVASLLTRLWGLAILDTLAFLLLVVAALWKGLGDGRRLAFLTGTIIAISGAVLFATGPYGAGYVYLICAVFLAALFGGRALVVSTTVLSVAILSVYAILIATGHAPVAQPLGSLAVVASNLVLVCAIFILATRSLVKGLEKAYVEEERLAGKVTEELEALRVAESRLRAEASRREALLREVEHRVHNNLQLMSSLVSLESRTRDPDALQRISRRVQALSFANDAILADPGRGSVDFHRLVADMSMAIAAQVGRDWLSVEAFEAWITDDEAPAMAIAVLEIIERLQGCGQRISLVAETGREGLSLVVSCAESEAMAIERFDAAVRAISADAVLMGFSASDSSRLRASPGKLVLTLRRQD